MDTVSRRLFLGGSLALAGCNEISPSLALAKNGFVCPPCGCSQDGSVFSEPGRCSACGMTLGPQSTIDLGYEPSKLVSGAGSFTLGSILGRSDRPIQVDYLLPPNETASRSVVLVLPGTGRNSSEYRNQWLAHSRVTNSLVAALSYPELTYDFAGYHLGGTVKSFDPTGIEMAQPNPTSTVLTATDEQLQLEPNSTRSQWIFADFDKVFDFLKAAAGISKDTYDIIGHSAGGQLLHRAAIVQWPAKAKRILAANSGFYTLPDEDAPIPLGLGGLNVEQALLASSFAQELVVLLGENDNSPTAGGTFLRSPSLDKQGRSRLDRGRSFFQAAKSKARELNVPFNWQLVIVPGVGHDGYGMSQAASEILQG